MMAARVNLTSELPRDLPSDALLHHGTFLINLEGEQRHLLHFIYLFLSDYDFRLFHVPPAKTDIADSGFLEGIYKK